MSSYWSDKEEQIAYLQARLNIIEEEVKDYKKRVEDAHLLVAGAMRQGFTNYKQRDALKYAFMRLAGWEFSAENEKLAIHVQPKGWNTPRLPKAEEQKALPPPKDVPPYERQDYNDDPWGSGI